MASVGGVCARERHRECYRCLPFSLPVCSREKMGELRHAATITVARAAAPRAIRALHSRGCLRHRGEKVILNIADSKTTRPTRPTRSLPGRTPAAWTPSGQTYLYTTDTHGKAKLYCPAFNPSSLPNVLPSLPVFLCCTVPGSIKRTVRSACLFFYRPSV